MFDIGKSNSALEKIWQRIPAQIGQKAPLTEKVDLNSLLPKNLTHYRFSGSLTTPPCTEGVRWLVVQQPMTVTVQQLNAFTSVMHHANNRPVQKLDGRVIVSE
jgi:carbonic anhydrase